MVSRTKKKSGKKSGVPVAGGGMKEKAVRAAKRLTGKDAKKSGTRRNRGPAYWANKVLVAKLKKKYNRLKFGGM